jgi:hypothetical protein
MSKPSPFDLRLITLADDSLGAIVTVTMPLRSQEDLAMLNTLEEAKRRNITIHFEKDGRWYERVAVREIHYIDTRKRKRSWV